LELLRQIAALESYDREQIRWFDGRMLYRSELSRMRDQAATEWRHWITDRFGAHDAEAYLTEPTL
jgi:hypothetical protein